MEIMIIQTNAWIFQESVALLKVSFFNSIPTACQGTQIYPQQILLNEFSVSADGAKDKATLGGEIALSGHPKIRISLAFKKPVENKVKVRLIRAGKLIRTFTGKLPMEIEYEDKYHQPGQKIYYRMDVTGHGILVSNPIFVKFQ